MNDIRRFTKTYTEPSTCFEILENGALVCLKAGTYHISIGNETIIHKVTEDDINKELFTLVNIKREKE